MISSSDQYVELFNPSDETVDLRGLRLRIIDGLGAAVTHHTEDRMIRLIGDTAILSGIYVNPANPEPWHRLHYTDTWMWLDDHWQVVASHLSYTRLS